MPLKYSLSPTRSLGVRLLVALTAMLLPLFVLGAGTYYSFRLLSSSFTEVVEESLLEMLPVAEIQLKVQNWHIVLNHLVRDGSAEDRRLLADLGAEVEQAFSVRPPFQSATEREELEQASLQWRQAAKLAGAIMISADPGDDPAARRALAQVKTHLEQASAHLNRVRSVISEEIARELDQTAVIKARVTRLNSAVFLLGVGMVVAIGLLLARSLLRPVRQLTDGAKRFAAGDLSHRIDSTGTDELGLLTEAFNAMAQTLERDRRALQELSVRDPLTGLYNHREFFRLLTEELERARRYFHPLSMLMLDLDFFKKINDTYGHPVGDQAIRAVAELVSRELRRVDEFARYGGEEFAVILPETSGSEALAIADRIRQAIAARPLAIPETEGVPLTVSIGLAVYPEDAEGVDGLMKKADKALYQAKNEGRNRVCWAGVTSGKKPSGIDCAENVNPS